MSEKYSARLAKRLANIRPGSLFYDRDGAALIIGPMSQEELDKPTCDQIWLIYQPGWVSRVEFVALEWIMKRMRVLKY